MLSIALGNLYTHYLLRVHGLYLNILLQLWLELDDELYPVKPILTGTICVVSVKTVNMCEVKLSLEHVQGPGLDPTTTKTKTNTQIL